MPCLNEILLVLAGAGHYNDGCLVYIYRYLLQDFSGLQVIGTSDPNRSKAEDAKFDDGLDDEYDHNQFDRLSAEQKQLIEE